jgi:hypothetical protein
MGKLDGGEMSDDIEEIKAMIADANEEALLADGFDGALIGFVEIPGKLVALYDKEKCIEILMLRDGMSYEGAYDFFEFNVRDAFVGEGTPAFATILRKSAH